MSRTNVFVVCALDQSACGWRNFFFPAYPHKCSPPNTNLITSFSGRKIFGAFFKLGIDCPSGTRLLQYSVASFGPFHNCALAYCPSPYSSKYASSKMTEVKGTSKQEDEFSIKPQAVTPALDTSNWPLLLKNYDKRTMASSDYCSMIKQDRLR